MRSICLLLLLLSTFKLHAAESHFTVSKNCKQAYKDIISFRLVDGHAKLTKEIKTDPYNHLIILLQNYEDFIRLTFQDDPALYKRRKSFKDKRLAILKNSDKQSPYHRLCRGIIHLQWSLIHVKYKENWKAANDFRKAHSLFKENKRLFPDFKETDIFYGAQQTIIGTIPKDYKWITNFLGLRGNITNGMKLLKGGVNTNTSLFQEEAKCFYIFLNAIILNDSKKALRLIKSYKLDTKNNYLYAFTSSNLMLNNFRAKEAINIINNRNKGNNYAQPIIFDYALGAAYLHSLEYNKAIPYLQKYLRSKSYFYKKDATLKIAYAYHLMGNSSKSTVYLNKVPNVGSSITDMDKQALKVYKTKRLGNKTLLKARLLFDGGSFSQSISFLENKALKANLPAVELLEWNYRLARVYDETKKTQLALAYYKKTLSTPNPSKEYYPARAALQIAYIHERTNNKVLATKYFKKVLSLEGHQYKTSLDQKAKSGLLRINNK